MENVYLAIVLAPLVAAVVTGLARKQVGRAGAHWIAIVGVGISFVLSLVVLKHVLIDGVTDNVTAYNWMVADGIQFQVGFLVDRLTALMVTVVSFVSLMVHIYTVGYMHDDPGYQRFFGYIALFTFSMLMLVMANNFLQLFFGWEAVGLVSYLLIGFWFTRPSATFASLKAFLVNRVGDFGFILGIALVLYYTGSLNYSDVFAHAPRLEHAHIEILAGHSWALPSVIGILLFVGAMGKSAQVPLHVWLPDSMEGPTPISALIHAATMVTAGIFMVARMSPLYELSDTALSVILVISGTTALFLGLVGIVQNDIKRVIAYSTISQLGYMFVAEGASAYSAGIFHLMTHAFFKALLFLGAGSVIIALHHEQDMRRMGGLRKYMPITYWTFLAGSLALIAFPGFAGFYSKDSIIEAVHASGRAGAGYAYWCVLIGAFVTALYTFRMFFLVFHGKERMDEHARAHLRESPWVVTVPLILLALPSVVIGAATIKPLLFGNYFGDAIRIAPDHDVLHMLGQEHFHGVLAFTLDGFTGLPFWFAMAGLVTAWFFYMQKPELADRLRKRLGLVYTVLVKKFYFDELNQAIFAAGARLLGRALWQGGDVRTIDGFVVNGSARAVGWFSGRLRKVQSGYLYHYAFAMIIGLCILVGWFLVR